jgi:hypothetical protein
MPPPFSSTVSKMSDERTCWSLHRLGWNEPKFILREVEQVVTLGRACDANKQCLGKEKKRRRRLRQVQSHLTAMGRLLISRADNSTPNSRQKIFM